MASQIEARLKELGIEVPAAVAPAANYVPTVRSGMMLYVSGQLPALPPAPEDQFTVTDETADRAKQTARRCGISILSQIKSALGDFDQVARIVKLVGFVNSAPTFTGQPGVVNGASDLMVEVFGDAGRHARSAVGVASLPLGVAVEVEAIVEIKA